MRRWLERDRLSWRLGLSVALLVIGGQAVAFFLVYRYCSERLLEATREHASLETRLIREALEYQMIERDDRLIRTMVRGFARGDTVERVMILDRTGTVRFSSDPAIHARHFRIDDPTCQACHRRPPAEREGSVLLTLAGDSVLRCVQPIANHAPCHRCHDPGHRLNGIIVVDVPLGATLTELERSVGTLALGTGAVALLLIAGTALIFRRLVLRRLLRFASTARAISAGDLGRRVPVDGRDALADVERQFNQMADSVTGLLGELRQRQASLERVMNSVDDGMAVLDRGRRVVAANDAFLRRFPGGPPADAGRPCSCERSPAPGTCPSEGAECPTLACFATGAVHTVLRARPGPDGSRRLEEVRASPVYAEDGTISHVVEVWRDITDRRSAEAHLAEYQRLVSLGMLASGFSHEVNTPLASIGTCLDGIRRLCDGPGGPSGLSRERILEYARVASTQVGRCGAITEQFLKLARGKSLTREIVDLSACADLVVRLCRHTARATDARIEVEGHAGLPPVLANEAAVQQVLLNLLLNAVEAGVDGRPLEIRISFRFNGQIELRVEDNGRGIAGDDLPRIFEPFFTRRARGTGLGLFVSMNLARSWGGDILVESDIGRGSAFVVTFPTIPSATEGSGGTGPGPGRR